jgi:putative addiction module component (TIGR02574 family)
MVPTMSAHLLLAELLALPLADRQAILEKLRESIEKPDSVRQAIEDAQFAECERRWRRIQSGEDKTIPWEEVRAELLADID